MKKVILYLFFGLFCLYGLAQNQSNFQIPGENTTIPAIEYIHFPSRMHTFIWRNWTTVPASRLAKVLNTTEDNVQKVAFSMGLDKQKKINPMWDSPNG